MTTPAGASGRASRRRRGPPPGGCRRAKSFDLRDCSSSAAPSSPSAQSAWAILVAPHGLEALEQEQRLEERRHRRVGHQPPRRRRRAPARSTAGRRSAAAKPSALVAAALRARTRGARGAYASASSASREDAQAAPEAPWRTPSAARRRACRKYASRDRRSARAEVGERAGRGGVQAAEGRAESRSSAAVGGGGKGACGRRQSRARDAAAAIRGLAPRARRSVASMRPLSAG